MLRLFAPRILQYAVDFAFARADIGGPTVESILAGGEAGMVFLERFEFAEDRPFLAPDSSIPLGVLDFAEDDARMGERSGRSAAAASSRSRADFFTTTRPLDLAGIEPGGARFDALAEFRDLRPRGLLNAFLHAVMMFENCRSARRAFPFPSCTPQTNPRVSRLLFSKMPVFLGRHYAGRSNLLPPRRAVRYPAGVP